MDKSHLAKIKRTDKVARIVIVSGGFFVITCVIAILLLIAREALPLFYPATSKILLQETIPEPFLTAGLNERMDLFISVNQSGLLEIRDVAQGKSLAAYNLGEIFNTQQSVVRAVFESEQNVFLFWSDHTYSVISLGWDISFSDQNERSVKPQIKVKHKMTSLPVSALPVDIDYVIGPDGNVNWVIEYDNREWVVLRETIKKSLFGGAKLTIAEYRFDLSGTATATLLPDPVKDQVYTCTTDGKLRIFNLKQFDESKPLNEIYIADKSTPVHAIHWLLGNNSLIVAKGKGSVEIWSWIRDELTQNLKLEKIHQMKAEPYAVTKIIPSHRQKTFMLMYENGSFSMHHSTSERMLFDQDDFDEGNTHAYLSVRSNGLVHWNKHQLKISYLSCTHPEISLKTLFAKVWYEGFSKPEWVWQSSSGSTDFEPKLSLTPLLFGSLKGTFYAMIFAVPFALGGAMYISYFASPAVRSWIKPAIEIVASIPSVVIGFLSALWFAPVLEDAFLPLMMVIPFFAILSVIVLLFLSFKANPMMLKKHTYGKEFIWIIPLFIMAAQLSFWITPAIETAVFGGHFNQWLYKTLDQIYDQRNSIVISFGLGFAVIPIIFTLADDALSSVPTSLSAASLAMGATRWQTLWRVILPSASPGIFAALMIGFGRAVGETMIVLMATGNTPIIDISPLNGMRTLSANIAVEMPEAPVGGTLYRVLFLSAILLLVMTSVLNTVAEIVRHNLRKKYGRY